MGEKKKAKAVIVGGSTAGVSCAHALISAGWDVVVLEKSSQPPRGSPTGAGLALDRQAINIIDSWLPQPQLLQQTTLPLTIDQNQTADGEKEASRILTRDEDFNFRAAHWADLHGLLYNALPAEVFLWADGCLSQIRKTFLPDLKLRYSGYCAWRGVLDFSGNEDSETIRSIQRVYPDLGKCLYFDLRTGSHAVLYELLSKRLNWIWYVHQPEPGQKGNSVTMKVSSDMVENMYREAEKIWGS
ncbi:hypothetical protein OIU77_005248 [Salix suchowensis]|uniref:Uncharacterized protein n=1 Tax=Salix suchowensis TaxID=1278906 RepID=A0ABQ9ANQ1_9ROSI|nr:hypothetical protein OIU77_005248 [Salix suchowensis]